MQLSKQHVEAAREIEDKVGLVFTQGHDIAGILAHHFPEGESAVIQDGDFYAHQSGSGELRLWRPMGRHIPCRGDWYQYGGGDVRVCADNRPDSAACLIVRPVKHLPEGEVKG
jgi:hypothetical protein